MLCAKFRVKQTKFKLTITNQETTKRVEQDNSLPADQATLSRGLCLNQGDLDPNNHGNVICIYGPSHRIPRTVIVKHTATSIRAQAGLVTDHS